MAAIRKARTTGRSDAKTLVDIVAVAAVFAFVAAVVVGLAPQAHPVGPSSVVTATALP